MSDAAKDSSKPADPKPPMTLAALVDIVKLKINKIKEYQLGKVVEKDPKTGAESLVGRFVGRAGHNPYLYLAQKVKPVEDKIEDGSITEKELNEFLKTPDQVTPDGTAVKGVKVLMRSDIRKQEAAAKANSPATPPAPVK